ncbi:hypothetical protein PWP93_30835 [Paraburkholderia sp. A1RI-2L]|uniref:hypothetical protein n=1 Tax=Paraburkholderia sp. A1RI-2L TaxID=3028367 RepID=UPI003B7EB7E7
MKKFTTLIYFSLACSLVQAHEIPVVGLWEQFAMGDLQSGNVVRHDLVFVDRKLTDDTVFSALMNPDTSIGVLCCVKVSKDASITLADLLKKYPLERDDADHLKSITGWKYIYEAKIIDSTSQNPAMRELVKNLTHPPSLSPYSAGIISGKVDRDEVPTTFSIDGVSVSYSVQTIRKYSAIQYKFSINGRLMKFTEDNFPD